MADSKRKKGLSGGVDAIWETGRPPVDDPILQPVGGEPERVAMQVQPIIQTGHPEATMPADDTDTDTTSATAKISVIISQAHFDQLEELKNKEKARLRKAGGNWRQVTLSQFINQAITEFLDRQAHKTH